MLTLYPAIDLKDGACVRLRRGDMTDATIYNTDPAAQARAFQDQGANWLHIVDLNGAFAGHAVNHAAVQAILTAVPIPIQLGGGIRDLASIEQWLNAGITRIILGSIALTNPDLVRTACRQFPSRIAVGIDARESYVATEGWSRTSQTSALELALQFEQAGAAAIIYTDIARDGMASGLNLDQTEALAARLSTPVIASGGVGSLADLHALKLVATRTPGIAGAIVGRALYDGSLTLTAALAALT